jgi:hypothetical protein
MLHHFPLLIIHGYLAKQLTIHTTRQAVHILEKTGNSWGR